MATRKTAKAPARAGAAGKLDTDVGRAMGQLSMPEQAQLRKAYASSGGDPKKLGPTGSKLLKKGLGKT